MDGLMVGVIYARYSPGPRQTEMSIEGQLRAGYKYAEDHGIRIIETYIDRKATGRNDKRTDFQRMLRDSKKGLFDCVITWKVDRIGRNREEIAKNKAILRVNGARVYYVDQSIPEGPEGILLESVLEGLAEYYSKNLAHDVLRGLQENAMKGRCNGASVPHGLAIGADKRYILRAEESPTVVLMYEMCDGGMRIGQIIKSLSEKGIKNRKGNDFGYNEVSRILRDRRYIGEYSWNGIVVPDGIPRTVPDDLFERVQKRLDTFKRAPAAKRSNVVFLLTGKLYCGKCKNTMIGDFGTSHSGDRYYYYTCSARKKSRSCTKKSVKKDWLETEVVRLTVERVLQSDVLAWIADRIVKLQEKESADNSMQKYYTERLRETNSAIKNIMKAIEAGIFTDTTKDRLEELEAERDQYTLEIEKEKFSKPSLSKEQILAFLRQFLDGDIHDKAYQERIIDAFVNKVILYEDKIIITYNYSGDQNEVAADIIESAAFDSDGDACSDTLSFGPPSRKKRTKRFFSFVRGKYLF